MKPRIAIVHDYLNQYGGAERVVEVLHELFPDAPVFTSLYNPQVMPAHYRAWDIRTTWMRFLPGTRRWFRLYFWLYPLAFETLDVRAYDVIITSSSAYAKGIRPAPGAVQICYCHTPMRWAWRTEEYVAREGIGRWGRQLLQPFLALLRRWDRGTAARVDTFIANSHEVAGRIRRVYGREAEVIPPPVDLPPFHMPVPPEDFYLTGGRLVPYKRIDLAIRACNALKLPLVVFGDGRDRAQLEALAGPTVRFVGRVDEATLHDLYRRCRAYITAAEEDAGIQPVEAMAAGRPVIALAAGGVLETVIEGVTGRFFHAQTAAALAVALAQSRADTWDAQRIAEHAQQWRRERFAERILAAIQRTQAGVSRASGAAGDAAVFSQARKQDDGNADDADWRAEGDGV